MNKAPNKSNADATTPNNYSASRTKPSPRHLHRLAGPAPARTTGTRTGDRQPSCAAGSPASRQFLRWVSSAALLLLLAACAQQTGDGPVTPPTRAATQESPTSSKPANPAAMAWVGQLCTTVGDLVQPIQDATPDTGSTTTPDDLKRAWSHQLAVASARLTATADHLGQLGPSPVADGDQAVRDLAAKYIRLIENVNRAEHALDTLAAGSNAKDVGQVMATISPTLAALTSHPLKDVTLSPDLTTAGSQSAACRTQWWWGLVGR